MFCVSIAMWIGCGFQDKLNMWCVESSYIKQRTSYIVITLISRVFFIMTSTSVVTASCLFSIRSHGTYSTILMLLTDKIFLLRATFKSTQHVIFREQQRFLIKAKRTRSPTNLPHSLAYFKDNCGPEPESKANRFLTNHETASKVCSLHCPRRFRLYSTAR